MMRVWFTFPFLFVLRSGLAQTQFILVDNQDDPDETRIVGGEMTSIDEHAHQVSLRYDNRHVCGGAIISEDWIITAAHCVKGYFSGFFTVKAGTTDITGRGLIKRVKQIISHEDYSRWTSDYDIAVIQLETPLVYSHPIQPISLPSNTDHYDSGSVAVVTGWGALRSNGTMPHRLRKVQVPLLSNAQCSRSYKNVRAITSRMLCAGYLDVGGKDACQGDSGGPLVQDDRLIGIVSWGFGCAEPSHPGVYTRVAAFRDWIQEQTGV